MATHDQHKGHTMEVATYGYPVLSMTIECVDCYVVVAELYREEA